MSPYALVLTAIFAALLGFLAGLVSYRASRRWCPACGASLACVVCLRIEKPRQPSTGR